MLSFDEALARVLGAAVELGVERVPLGDTFNRVLAQDIVADDDMPPFNKSAMDGYACRRADLGAPLSVVATIAAGGAPAVAGLKPGECAKIMTGAMVPAGADCVVMQEYVVDEGGGRMRFTGGETDANICPAGEDLRRGAVALRKGTLVRAQHLATMAALGCATPLVSCRPRVGIVATGSELRSPDQPINGAAIRDSNSHQLTVQAACAGALPRNYGIVKDEAPAIEAAIRAAMRENDLVIVSGGVSVGEFDLVPAALRACAFTFLFEKVAMKPGRPTIFGTAAGNKYCCGLPGNPVSTFVVFEVLLKPFLHRLMGHTGAPPVIRARLAAPLRRAKATRREAVPVRFVDPGTVTPVEYHGAAHISSLCAADGLIFLAAGCAEMPAGTGVDVRLLWP